MSELNAKKSNRGFKFFDPVPSAYAGTVAVSESSSAEYPHIWLRVECPENLNEPSGEYKEAVAHLTIENAQKLAQQLQYLVDNHYHYEYYNSVKEDYIEVD